MVVKRPPSAAQRRAYHAPSKGPPINVPKEKRPVSAKARLDSYSDGDLKTSGLPPRPPWRPFTRASSLSKLEGQRGFLHGNTEKDTEKDDNVEELKPSVYTNR